MNRRLIIRAEAEADIIDAAAWYESRESGLGFEVTAEIRAAIRRAVEYPKAHLALREKPEVIVFSQSDFPIASFTSFDPTQ
jgi:hypothetical protein